MSLASRKLIQATAGAAGAADTGDDDFANVVLLLDGDGTSDDDNNTFTDSSTNGFTITESGSVVQGSFSPYGDNWSNYFNGTDYIYGTVNALGTGDFTLECWVNFSSLGANRTIMSFGQFSPALYYRHASTELAVYHIANGGAFYLSGFTPEIGEWYHVAFTRSGTTSRMFVNGTQQGSDTTYSTNITDTTLRIGYDGVDYTDAYISNVRVVKGTALYTSNFTAPTSPLSAVTNTELLTCQSNRFVDNGSNSITVSVNSTPKVTPFSPFKNDDARTLTTDGGSGYFDDSSNSYLQIADNSVFDATTSLCIEAWFYMTSSPGSGPDAHAVVSKWVSTTPGQRTIFIDIENTGLRVYADLQGASNPVLITTDGGAISQHEWHHVAVTWDGSTYRAFLDGALEGSTSSSSAPIASSQVVRVGYNTNTHYFGGYITDVRWITDGGAIYTSGFTPPTSPLTAITNTELLLNFQDAGIYDRSGIHNLDTVGNAQIDTTIKKYGTGSMQFDGTGDYLTTTSNSLTELSFGTGDFTLEGWFYIQSGDEYPFAIDFRSAESQAAVSLYFYNYGNGSIDYYVSGASRILGTSAGNDVWQHIAVCRSGTSTKMFVNGTQSGSTYTDSTNYVAYSGNIARRYTNQRHFKGFIDDLRITKGIARYTANFTPPSAELPKF